jgi:hypothetical protein
MASLDRDADCATTENYRLTESTKGNSGRQSLPNFSFRPGGSLTRLSNTFQQHQVRAAVLNPRQQEGLPIWRNLYAVPEPR